MIQFNRSYPLGTDPQQGVPDTRLGTTTAIAIGLGIIALGVGGAIWATRGLAKATRRR